MKRTVLALAFVLVTNAAAQAEDPAEIANLKRTLACAGCDLSGAHLRVARIAGADLSEADLISADLGGANLAGANLIRASLVGANLAGAQLADANLIRAHIEDTDLSGVVGLTQAQLRLACGNANTRLPPGLTVRLCIGSEL